MNHTTHNTIDNFIWGIADEKLFGPDEMSEEVMETEE
jgi:hypothetical protein